MRCFLAVAMLVSWACADPSVEELQQRVQELEEQLKQAHSTTGDELSLDATGTAIMQNRFLYHASKDGYFLVPLRLRRFSLDVGFNRGVVMVQDWLESQQNYDTFMIGIEANPYLHTAFSLITTREPFPRGYEGLFWHAADSPAVSASHASQAGIDAMRRARILRNHSDQLLLIHAAASSSMHGVADFNVGFGWASGPVSDVGSLYQWSSQNRKRKAATNVESTAPVAILRLGDVLARVPPWLLWDTLKIDIQGADADALLSARAYLPRFMCVIGEFQVKHYAMPSGVILDPSKLLTTAGFHLLRRDSHGQLWINKRFRRMFEDYTPGRDENFTCSAGHESSRISKDKIANLVRALRLSGSVG